MGDEAYYELYGEYVSLRELAVSVLVSTALALLLYSLSPLIAGLVKLQAAGLSVMLGAIGATLGFAVSVFLTRVKRVVNEV
ncbi:MAG: hypothetical protein LM590_13590 [Thermofilum sp.]|jgi:hypothetical protein|nr:hypothetical protein [Thermofilum sp.]